MLLCTLIFLPGQHCHMLPAYTSSSQNFTWDKIGKPGEVKELKTVDKSENRVNFLISLFISDFWTLKYWHFYEDVGPNIKKLPYVYANINVFSLCLEI